MSELTTTVGTVLRQRRRQGSVDRAGRLRLHAIEIMAEKGVARCW